MWDSEDFSNANWNKINFKVPKKRNQESGVDRLLEKFSPEKK